MIAWIKSHLTGGVREVAIRAANVLDSDRYFARGNRPHFPRNASRGELERRRTRQPWLGLFFVVVLAAGVVYPPIALVALLSCGFGAMIIAVSSGRYWCDWMCPRGSFLDSFIRKISRGKPAPAFLRQPILRYGVLLWFVTFIFGLGILRGWGNPIKMSVPAMRLLLVSTGIAVVTGVVFHERTWCLFCPMGTASNLINKIAKLLGRDPETPILVDDESCVDCGRCNTVCRMEIDPSDYKQDTVEDHGDVFAVTAGASGAERACSASSVDHGDCLKCEYCVDECPTDALTIDGGASATVVDTRRPTSSD